MANLIFYDFLKNKIKSLKHGISADGYKGRLDGISSFSPFGDLHHPNRKLKSAIDRRFFSSLMFKTSKICI